VNAIRNRQFENILILKPSSIGDVVRSIPIAYGLRKKYPRARISWLVRPDCAAVLHTLPVLDEIVEFDRKQFSRVGRSGRVTRQFIGFLRELHQRRYDLVLDLQGLFRSGFIAFCTGASVRVGFGRARELAWCFYNYRVNTPWRPEHAVESYWRFAQVLGFGEEEKVFDLPLDPAADAGAGKLLEKAGVVGGAPFSVLLIGAAEPEKRWPAAFFGELAERIRKHYDMPSVLLGYGPDELHLSRTIEQDTENRIINLVNQTSLPQTISLLHRASLVVGNDSGPLHIAAAMNRPVVGLYGPTQPAVVGPYGQLDHVVQAAPSVGRRGRYSRHALHRMDAISVEEVFGMVQRILNSR